MERSASWTNGDESRKTLSAFGIKSDEIGCQISGGFSAMYRVYDDSDDGAGVSEVVE